MKELVCIVCPRGCSMKIEETENGVQITGNSCKRGKQFAESELTCPKRTICSTVATVFRDIPVVPVRVNQEIPKDKIFEVMEKINTVMLDKRLKRGEAVLTDVCGTGADVILTSNILAYTQPDS